MTRGQIMKRKIPIQHVCPLCVHPLLESKTVQPTMEIFRLLKDFDKSRHAASSTFEMALLEWFGGNHDYQKLLSFETDLHSPDF